MNLLFLFDIDGTILRFQSGLARNLFAELTEDFFGRSLPEKALPRFAGMTDMKIMEEIAESISFDKEDLFRMLPEFWIKMHNNFYSYFTPEFMTLLPGIDKLIPYFNNNQNIDLGLVTGNIYNNAYSKLKAFELDTYFEIGGFGCDSSDRNLLPLIAIDRANKKAGYRKFSAANTLIIGDTLRDIECAKVNNIAVATVSTGEFSTNELLEFEPDLHFNDFSNVVQSAEKILAFFNI